MFLILLLSFLYLLKQRLFSKKDKEACIIDMVDAITGLENGLKDSNRHAKGLEDQIVDTKRMVCIMKDCDLERIVVDMKALHSQLNENTSDISALQQQLKTTKRALSTIQQYNLENIVIDIVNHKKKIEELEGCIKSMK